MKKILLLGLIAVLSTATSFGQVNISAHNVDFTTDFNGWEGTLPTGFTHAGETTAYRGTDPEGTSGGVYSVGGAGYSYQPSGSADNLTLTGEFENNTGSAITELDISFEAFSVFHRTSRLPGWTVTTSLGESLSDLDWAYNESSSAGSPDIQTYTLTGISIAPGATFSISFASDRGSGSGSSPKIGINNITLQSVNAPCIVTGIDVQVACGSFEWIDGVTYTESIDIATHTIVGGGVDGCDSIVTLDLTINDVATGTDVQTACGSYEWINGVTYTESIDDVLYTIVGGAVNGCDSIVTLDLTINDVATGTDVQTACGSYEWIDGVTYTESIDDVTFTIVGGAVNGCDSIVTLDLTINDVATGTDVQTACGSYEWIDGVTYTESIDDVLFTIVGGAVNGCDSIVTLDLTINEVVTGTDVQTACGSFEWIDGVTYTESIDDVTFTIVGGAVSGCDSIVTLDLTINEAVTGTDVQTACGSYEWIDGVTYTESVDDVTYTIEGGAINGCDSIVTLDLTINEIATGTDVQEACISFEWINGETYTESVDDVTYTIEGGAANGCDSIVTLNLTILTVDVTVTVTDPTITANATDATYQWLDCADDFTLIDGANEQEFIASENGEYAVQITSENGCIDTSACVTIATVGIEENFAIQMSKVYPNPATGLFYVEVESEQVSSVKVYSITGELIYVNNSLTTEISTIDLSGLTGTYVVEITTANNREMHRIILQ
ncbi:T9SS type A sorting domain-containing protein [Crocinitomix algicola]|uniref:T9SS type A sorting domain-containing protein n=1 Tax=Crocinitomix algicola TaxID=1740263 RepID=UPI00082B3E2B|nr:T9SS type A sorting domain-containing protein [Crocinitomix algicola]